MEERLKYFSDIDNCPVRNVVMRFGAKWPMLILLLLHTLETARFTDIMRYIPDISSKVLSKELKNLEADDLVNRKMYAEIPPRVEYSLTERGQSLIPVLQPLIKWAIENMKPIKKSRSKYNN